MGHIRMGAPRDLVKNLAKACGARVFVETGTFHGDTAAWAAIHFDRVITIEISERIHASTRQRLGRFSNIDFLCGDSARLLPGVVHEIKGPAVFWLDGHYSGPGTGGESAQCPVLAELEAISAAPAPLLFIDDARCFLGPPPAPLRAEHWPSIATLFATLHDNWPKHYVTLRDDVIIAVPADLKPVLDSEWLAFFANRYPPLSSGGAWTALAKALFARIAGDADHPPAR